MANVMPVERRNSILRLLVEGNSIRSVTRLLGTNIPSVLRQLAWAGDHCRKLMDERCRGLKLAHLEMDETWTYVAKKQGRLTVEERAERSDIGDVYLWVAIDETTKFIPAYLLGKRTGDNARRFARLVASRLAMPNAHASDDHAFEAHRYDPVTQISTDGFSAYPEAIDQFFGPYATHGVLIKDYRNSFEKPGNYTPAEMVGTDRRVVRGEIDPYDICTSHCERWNATARTFMKRFARLTLAFSKKLENLENAVALFIAYYDFCWRTRYPDDSGKCGQRRPTAAMMAGVTDRLWSFADLMNGGT